MKNKSFKAIPVIIVMTLLCQLPVYADALRPAAMHERPRQVIPGRYFSRAKFERYCGGPGGIFTHSADISSKLKQAFSEDPVRIVRVDGERKIEIDIARVQFLDWYERRFGLIPPDKTSTASRNYLYAVVHLLFHKVGFAGILSDRISVENVPAGTLAKFLNEFNRLFGVILDPAGRPAVIDEEFISNGSNSGMLSYLYEEIGAKYPMGLMEDWDSANKFHPVYERFGFRRGEKMVRLRDIIEGCVDEAFMKAKAAGLENVGRSEVDIRKA
ncbi:MAG: hypothetical protein ABH825_04725, partial [Candidatus Omnitrophota bacterium]